MHHRLVDIDTKGKTNTKPARGKRGPLPAELARVDVVHVVLVAERTFPCGTPMVEIGEDVSEQLDLVPMQVCVLRSCAGSQYARRRTRGRLQTRTYSCRRFLGMSRSSRKYASSVFLFA